MTAPLLPLHEMLLTALPLEGKRLWRLFLSHLLKEPVDAFFFHPYPHLNDQQYQQLSQWIKQAMDGVPWSRIVQEREFWSLSFSLSPATLDPRPDSETMVEAVLQTFPDKLHPYAFADLGTGSGCLLIALLSEYRQASGIGIDINLESLHIAQSNAHRHGLTDRTKFLAGNWLHPLHKSVDVLISNPPYISDADYERLSPIVKNFDPPQALKAGSDGLEAYRIITKQLASFPYLPSHIFLEIGHGQKNEVSALFQKIGYPLRSTFLDLQAIPRILYFSHM